MLTTMRGAALRRSESLRSVAFSGAILLMLSLVLGVTALGVTVFGVSEASAAPQPVKKTTQQERRHLRHILVRTEAKADEVLKLAKEGKNFRTLARKYSLDVTTKVIGGDLGENGQAV